MGRPDGETYDYVVVGSGAGGGVAAARLAEAGLSVCLLEAGADPDALKAEGLPEDYEVPAFHPFASENKAIAWNYWVRDFGGDKERMSRPPDNPRRGVLYPRASTLGGCTAHHAMIFIAPHDSDWDGIAEATGDKSWRADAMRRYFQTVENCRYRPFARLAYRLTGRRYNPTGHGFDGWLSVERPPLSRMLGLEGALSAIRAAIRDKIAMEAPSILAQLASALFSSLDAGTRFALDEQDPNALPSGDPSVARLVKAPLSTDGGRRRGSRERVREAMRAHPLHIAFDSLATRVLFDGNRAIGVEYLNGRNLYRASPETGGEPVGSGRVFARREVILAAGAFNTPQLLMLSGIGPPDELAAHGVEVRIPLAGVGRNLQDRYEIGAVHKTREPWSCLKGVAFSTDDPVYRRWVMRRGMYLSNGAAAAMILRSSVSEGPPDLFIMALLTRFSGYFPGYSNDIRASRDDLTFAILKAHTINNAGRVTLASADPRDPPQIDFRGFEEGADAAGKDLTAVVEALAKVRAMAGALTGPVLKPEDIPGPSVAGDAAVRQFIRENAWGHHASCTCPIGAPDNGGVLTSDFRVHGTEGLRVVDASVFPHIPGFFIVSAVYMIAEKAADVILAEAGRREVRP